MIHGKNNTCSPRDGDLEGFLSLLRQWSESRGLGFRESDMWNFAAKWSAKTTASLRTPKQWVNEFEQEYCQ